MFLSRIVLPMLGVLIIAIKIIINNGKDISRELLGVNFQSTIAPLPDIVTNHRRNFRGVKGGWAGWAIAHPEFGRILMRRREQRRAALLLAYPALGSQLRP